MKGKVTFANVEQIYKFISSFQINTNTKSQPVTIEQLDGLKLMLKSSLSEIKKHPNLSENILENLDVDFLTSLQNKIQIIIETHNKEKKVKVGNVDYILEDLSDSHMVNIYYFNLIFFRKDIRLECLDFSRELSKRKINLNEQIEVGGIKKWLYKPRFEDEIRNLRLKGMVKHITNMDFIVLDNTIIGYLDKK